MTGRTRLSGAIIAVVAVLSALAGCSGSGGHAATLPPVTTTPSAPTTTVPPTQTGEPTPSTTLTLFDEHDASVDAFVQSFFEAYNAAQDSRDLSAFDALYLPQCTGCKAMRDELAGWLANGQTIEGGDWHIVQQRSTALQDGSRGEFDALVYRDRFDVKGGDGAVVLTLPTSAVQLATGGVRPSTGWKLEGFSIELAPQ